MSTDVAEKVILSTIPDLSDVPLGGCLPPGMTDLQLPDPDEAAPSVSAFNSGI
jgi:hypothetical protein